MRLLTDQELRKLITDEHPIVLDLPVPADWKSRSSPVQPASLDLHVGQIYVPGVEKEKQGGQDSPLDQLVLAPGETAMVLTLETLKLKPTITGFGFPPARVSSGAILMTNPGHIDPGYDGKLRFTLINMGREDFVIRTGDSIVTLLLIELDQVPESPYRERVKASQETNISFQELRLLSRDFLDLRERTTKIAREEIRAAELDIKRAQARLPVIAAIIAALLTGLFGFGANYIKPSWEAPVQEVKTKMEVLSSQLNVAELNSRLAAIEARLPVVADTSRRRAGVHR